MSGLCDTCRLKPRCISPAGEVIKCNIYDPEDKSRWFELFGTPERAARTLTGICDKVPNCDVCQISEIIGEQCNYEMLLEWLRGEDEVIDELDTIRNELMDSGLLRGDAE